MLTVHRQAVLVEMVMPGRAAWTGFRPFGLVLVGVFALTLAAKTVVPMWPVPMTMGTFAVLTLGAVYGPRLGLITVMAYLACGALGLDVFSGTASSETGLAYMVGPTGGYLAGYVFAVLVIGLAARAGWDRSVPRMALSLLAGNVVIYLPGLAWLGVLFGWDRPLLAWGVEPFLVGDVLKLCLATCVTPLAWRMVSLNRR
ncbi:biotin transporter BioY [Salipiger mucosus]|uniref:Biotin transporter n=1 Tax=Salipiger mucosus DSM 16094 TaxID=1123237 RepID=S9SBM2_9RHOB|nr:biotin transporter BioY [Salipiger mucosus]EPX83599.1 Substrate-specific component BioY of biotin ECF transporter [Salipiger mucosus DSM 16094]